MVIVAQSASGRYISVSKVRVSLSDAEIDLDPRATVTPTGVPTATTLGFLVTLEEATSYKYILRKNREAVPAYDEVKESGIESSESRLLLEELDPRTGYTLYLIACNGDIHAPELVTASATTANPDYASYYAAYESGAELEIGGLVVSKAVFGEATLLTEETKTITADGVYFVPDGVTATYASGTRNTLIVIGDNPSGRGEFTITTTRITFNPTNRGHFVLFNLHFGLSTANGEGQILFYPNSTAGGHDADRGDGGLQTWI